MRTKGILAGFTLGASMLLMVSGAFAGDGVWDFVAPDVTAQPGDVIEVDLVITQDSGADEAFAADIKISDLSAFSDIDLSNCMAEFPPNFIQTCNFRPAPDDDTIRINWSSDAAGNYWDGTYEARFVFEVD